MGAVLHHCNDPRYPQACVSWILRWMMQQSEAWMVPGVTNFYSSALLSEIALAKRSLTLMRSLIATGDCDLRLAKVMPEIGKSVSLGFAPISLHRARIDRKLFASSRALRFFMVFCATTCVLPQTLWAHDKRWRAPETTVEVGSELSNSSPAVLRIQTSGEALSGVEEVTSPPCFPVDVIALDGWADIIGRDDLEGVTRPFAVSCQNNESVAGLLKAINGLFAERGFVTTQAWLPEQDIAKNRTLVVRVVPGRVDTVVYKEDRQPYRGFFPRMAGLTASVSKSKSLSEFSQQVDNWLEGGDDDLERLTLLPESARIALTGTIAKDDVLHVDRLQDTLDGINRVPSSKAKAELAPGNGPATSQVQITNRITDAFRLYGGYDTESIEGVDKLRFGVTAEKDNLLGINDTWGMTLKSGIETNELSGDFAVPIRRATVRLKGDWSENIVELGPLSELFMTTWNVSAGLDWIVHASRTERVVADFTVAHREQNRYINGLDLADQRVSPAQAGVTYSRFFEHGSVSGRIGVSQGLPIFNARQDARDIERFTPHTEFTKLDASLSGSYVFPGRASFSSSLSSQWAATSLYSDDQMTIGSRGSVRGFSNGSFKADRGAVWRNEVALAMPVESILGKTASATGADPAGLLQSSNSAPQWTREALAHLNPYLFLDAGLGLDIANDVTGYRVGSGAGLRYGGPRLSFDLGYAWRIAEDARSRGVSASKGELFMTLRFKVF